MSDAMLAKKSERRSQSSAICVPVTAIRHACRLAQQGRLFVSIRRPSLVRLKKFCVVAHNRGTHYGNYDNATTRCTGGRTAAPYLEITCVSVASRLADYRPCCLYSDTGLVYVYGQDPASRQRATGQRASAAVRYCGIYTGSWYARLYAAQAFRARIARESTELVVDAYLDRHLDHPHRLFS